MKLVANFEKGKELNQRLTFHNLQIWQADILKIEQ